MVPGKGIQCPDGSMGCSVVVYQPLQHGEVQQWWGGKGCRLGNDSGSVDIGVGVLSGWVCDMMGCCVVVGGSNGIGTNRRGQVWLPIGLAVGLV